MYAFEIKQKAVKWTVVLAAIAAGGLVLDCYLAGNMTNFHLSIPAEYCLGILGMFVLFIAWAFLFTGPLILTVLLLGFNGWMWVNDFEKYRTRFFWLYATVAAAWWPIAAFVVGGISYESVSFSWGWAIYGFIAFSIGWAMPWIKIGDTVFGSGA